MTETQPPSELGQFCVDFVKAFLQVGYYTADHPQAQRFLEGLHDSFHKAIGQQRELSFIKWHSGNQEDIKVDGFDQNEEVSLGQILPKEVSHLFLPKMLEFFHRKHLLSFSLKAQVSRDDFVTFVTLMSESVLMEDGQHRVPYTSLQISTQLQREGVTTISVVVEDDLLYVKGKLPWRVEVALARMRRDLSVLPVFQNKQSDELLAIESEIVTDIMRPVRDPDFARDILMHVDLVKTGAGLNTDLEARVLRCLSHEVRLPTVISIISFSRHKGEAKLLSDKTVQERALEILDLMIPALLSDNSTESHEILRQLYLRKLLSFEQLPEAVKAYLFVEDATNRFLNEPLIFLSEFGTCAQLQEYRPLLESAVAMFHQLVGKQELPSAAKLLTTLANHATVPYAALPERMLHAEAALSKLWQDELYHQLFDTADRLKPQEREALLHIADVAGVRVIGQLIALFELWREESWRRRLEESLRKIGHPALAQVVEKLLGKMESESLFRHLIGVLTALEDPVVVPELHKLVSSAHAMVRLAAVDAIARILKDKAEPELNRLLHASHDDVVERALDLLSHRQNLDVETMKMVLRKLVSSENPEFQVKLLMTISRLGNIDLAGDLTLEIFILRWWHDRHSASEASPKTRLTPEVEIAACRLLGKIGGADSQKFLTTIKNSTVPEVAQQSTAALKYLDQRLKRK